MYRQRLSLKINILYILHFCLVIIFQIVTRKWFKGSSLTPPPLSENCHHTQPQVHVRKLESDKCASNSEFNNTATLVVLMAQKWKCTSSVVPDCKKFTPCIIQIRALVENILRLEDRRTNTQNHGHSNTIFLRRRTWCWKVLRKIELSDALRDLQHR